MRSAFVVLLVLAAAPLAAQSKKPAATTRTADGRPDLQGTWDFAQLTPFERPSEFAGKETVTDEEAEEFAQKRIETTHKDRRDGGAAADVERAYNDFWWDFGRRIAKQPSLVVDPADGRVPALVPQAQQRIAARRNHFDNPEERPLAERCILGFNSGPPMVPSAYNNNVQIVQTRDHVLVLNEMIHSARIVDLRRDQHAPAHIRFLTGDSIGRWDGDTLVVDTTNFSTEGGFRGASTKLHLVEGSRAKAPTRCATSSPSTIRRRGPSRGAPPSRWHGPTSACSSTHVTRATTRSRACSRARVIRRELRRPT